MARNALGTHSALLALILAAGSVSSVAHAQSWAVAADGSWFVAANWTPQAVPTGNTALPTLGLVGPYTVNTSSNTLMGVHVTNPGATLTINGTQSLTLDGAIDNTLNGVIRVNTAGAFQGTSLNILQPGTSFSGTGTLRLNSNSNDGATTSLTARLYTSGAGTLTMGAGTTLAGFGYVGPLSTTNNVTFNADLNSRPIRIEGSTHQNNGLYTASNGGHIVFVNATVNQSAMGSMAPGADSQVYLHNTTVSGGSLVSNGTGRMISNGGQTSTVSGVTIGGGMDLNGTSTTFIGAPGIVLGNNATVLVNTSAAFQGTHIRTHSPNTPITGGGTIRLNASPNDGPTTSLTAAISEGGGGTGSYLFGPGVTLAGFGIVSNVPTTNGGTFNADHTGRPLRVDGNTHTNNALYTATNGGALQLVNMVLNQSPGAEVSAVGTNGDGSVASSVQLSNANITGGHLTSNGAARVTALGGSSQTLTGVNINNGMDLNGTTNVYIDSPGITLNGGTTLVNTFAAFQGTHIRTGDPDTLINGSGTVRLNASSNDGATTSLTAAISEDGGDAGGSFVFAPAVTLAGFGIVNSVPTTNNGTFNADHAGHPLRINGSIHQNNNHYRSSNTGLLWLTGTTINQSWSASMLAGNNSGVEINNSRVNGGTVGSAVGTNGNTALTGVSTLDGVEVSRQMNVNGGSTLLTTGNGIILGADAVVTVNPAAAFAGTHIRANGAATAIGGAGTIRLNASANDGATTSATADLQRTDAGSFVFGSGVKVDGFGRIYDVPTLNNGTINANVPGRPLRIEGNVHQNSNAYRSSNGGTLWLVGPTVNQVGSGFFDAGDGSSVSLSGGTVSGGAFTATGSGRFINSGTTTLDGGLVNSAPIDVNGNTTLVVGAAGMTNNNVILVNTDAAFAGTRVHGNTPTSAINGTGEVRLNKSTNDGATTSGTADVGSTGAGNVLAFGAGQRMTGSGRAVGTLTMGGIVAPGVGDGNVSFIRNDSAMTFAPSGGMTVDLATTVSFDRVVNTGTMAVDGTLRVNAATDFPSATTFDIVTGGTVTGAFDTVLSTGLAAPKRFGAAVTPGRVRVTVLCGLADIGGAGADANGDGMLDNNDFIVFIDRFFARDPLVDFGGPGGQQGSDGLFDNNDFIAFIDLFFGGCF